MQPGTEGALGRRSVPSRAVLVVCSGIGEILSAAVYLPEGATRLGYGAWQQPISALSRGPGRWVQQSDFVFYDTPLVQSAGSRDLWLDSGQPPSGTGGAAYSHFPFL